MILWAQCRVCWNKFSSEPNTHGPGGFKQVCDDQRTLQTDVIKHVKWTHTGEQDPSKQQKHGSPSEKKKTKQQARNILSRGWFSRVCKRKNSLFITINWKWKWRNKISCKTNPSWRPFSCSFSGSYFAFLYSNSFPKAWFLESIWDF